MPQISTSELTGFCRRVGTMLKSGVAVVRIWEQESARGSPGYRRAMTSILERIKRGDMVASAMRDTQFFPPVAEAMVEIGEHTGKLDEALARLADHYERQRSLQRQFLFGIAWPAFQLVIGLFIVGMLILILGMIGSRSGSEPMDVTGLGLAGPRGALVYFLIVGMILTGTTIAIMAIANGWLGPAPIRIAMQLPLIGACLRYTSLSRLTWSLGMALDSGMDARRATELSIVATQNPFYLSKSNAVTDSIACNRQFYESFRDAEGFPADFLLELETAEIAGTLSESLVRLSREYNDRAQTALQVLTWACTIAIWLLFGLIMIAMIFRLALMFIIDPLYEALEMTEPHGT